MDFKNSLLEIIPSSFIPQGDILKQEDLTEFASNCNVVKYNKKDIIFKQNTRTSHVMFIKKGFVKIYKEGRNNKVIILRLCTEGNFLGLMSLFGEETFNYSSSAIEESEILFIDIESFLKVLKRNGNYTTYLLKIISKSNLYIFEKLLNQTQKQLPGRVADIILYFSEEIYQSDSFEFPLTRTELAELAGTTKESLIRTLTEFRNDKIINLDNKNVEIKSMDIIKTLSRIG